MEAIVAIIFGCGLPASIVGFSLFYKYKKEQLKLQSTSMSNEDKQLLLNVKKELNSVNERMVNLEYIVTNMDDNLLPPKNNEEIKQLSQKVENLTKLLKE